MDSIVRLIAGIPGWLLDHPIVEIAGIALAATGYVVALRMIFRREDRRERQAQKRRYGA